MSKINVQGREITVISFEEKDYISLTDMVRNIENGLALIEKWLRNKNTIEFLGIWEEMYNPEFKSPKFEEIKNDASLNRFVLSVKKCVEKSHLKGMIAKAGPYRCLDKVQLPMINLATHSVVDIQNSHLAFCYKE